LPPPNAVVGNGSTPTCDDELYQLRDRIRKLEEQIRRSLNERKLERTIARAVERGDNQDVEFATSGERRSGYADKVLAHRSSGRAASTRAGKSAIG
jgi:hypothetical protein